MTFSELDLIIDNDLMIVQFRVLDKLFKDHKPSTYNRPKTRFVDKFSLFAS